MKVQVYEEKYEPPVELQKTKKIILTQKEYNNLRNAFCKGKGWNLDYPDTVNVRSITLKGNYKWMPATDVEFHIEVDGQEKHPIIETSNRITNLDMEKENVRAQ
jgi:hypothetical protein